jgi:colicin import membrane protein
LLHAAVLGWALFTIQTQRELRVSEPEAVIVDLVPTAEVTKVRQGVRTAKQMDAEAKETPKAAEVPRKEAPKPTPVATPKPPEPAKPDPPKEEVKEAPKPEPPKPEPPKEVAKAEPPKLPEPATDPIAEKLAAERPDPAIEQAKKLEEERREAARKAEEQRVADEQKKAEEQKKREDDEKRRKEAELKKKKEDDEKKRKAAELKKKQDDEKKRKEAEAKRQKSFDDQMREMQALLNKVPDKGAPLPNTPQEEPSKNKGPVLGAKEGRDKQLSASESARLVGLLIRKIQECYRPPVGAAAGLEGLKVRLSFDLNREGSVIGTPRATGVDGAPVSRVAAEAAERAVFGCQPYDMLPPDKYEAWKGIDLIFNPKDLFGG